MSTTIKELESSQRWIGLVTITAGLCALLSLTIGLVGVDFNFDTFSDASSLIAIGTAAARFIRWSNWLNLFGSYLLLVPLALYLYQWLRADSFAALLCTVSGLFYLFLGAAGAAILAATWPRLIEQYATATVAQQEMLIAHFQLATAIGESGLQGVIQNFCGTVWFVGMGMLLRVHRKGLGLMLILLGSFQFCNTLGNLFAIELLSLLGLTATILLVPLWAIAMGIHLLLRPRSVT